MTVQICLDYKKPYLVAFPSYLSPAKLRSHLSYLPVLLNRVARFRTVTAISVTPLSHGVEATLMVDKTGIRQGGHKAAQYLVSRISVGKMGCSVSMLWRLEFSFQAWQSSWVPLVLIDISDLE